MEREEIKEKRKRRVTKRGGEKRKQGPRRPVVHRNGNLWRRDAAASLHVLLDVQ